MSKTLERKPGQSDTASEADVWLLPLPERLRALRESRGFAGKQVAKALGISQPTYYLIESGTTALSLARLAQLAEFYDEPLERVASGYVITDAEARTVEAGKLLSQIAAPAP